MWFLIGLRSSLNVGLDYWLVWGVVCVVVAFCCVLGCLDLGLGLYFWRSLLVLGWFELWFLVVGFVGII